MPERASVQTRRALLARAFSLSGVLPLGAFLVVHVGTNLQALRGERAFDAAVRAEHRLPGLPVLEALLVFAPLILHGGYGVWLVATGRSVREPSPYPRALRLALRVTGVVALAFLALHLPELRFRGGAQTADGGVLLTILATDLSSMQHGVPWRAVAYLLGSACVAFHFALGLWGSFAGTPHGSDARARRRAAVLAGVIGVGLWVLFADAVVFHATGARLVGHVAPDVPSAPCPPASAP